jgi:hypothetical protein
LPDACNESARALNFARHVELFNGFGFPELQGRFGNSAQRAICQKPALAAQEEMVQFGGIRERLNYFAQGVRIRGFVGSSFVGFFSCLLVFFSFMF